MKSPRYIAIEGPIGVGKTTLSARLAKSLAAEVLLEAPQENPFLGPFYDNPQAHALPAQLFFLLQRARQIDSLRQRDMFASRWITDFMFDKDPLFARLTLSGPELALYQDIFDRLAWQAPVPDKVVYLYAPLPVLMARVEQRGRSEEHNLKADYLAQVAASYADFFSQYRAAPLVTVNAAELDLVNSETDFQRLLNAVLAPDAVVHLPE